MFNRAPSPGRLTLALLCLAGLVGLFFLARCAGTAGSTRKPAETLPEAKMAHLAMLNSSECEWRIVIAPATGGPGRTCKLAVAASIDIELPGGEYEIEQTMLTDDAGPDATRRFSMRLEAGQAYRWRLVALLAGESLDAIQPSDTKAGHD